MVSKPGQWGDRIAAARRDVGLTQEECASRAELPLATLVKIETGAGRVSSLDLARLANALDMRIEWFFEEAPPAVVSRRNAAEVGAPSPRIDRMTERVAREVEFLQDIGDCLDLPSTPRLPFPTHPEEIEARASEVRELLGYQEGKPALGLSERAADLGLLAFSLRLGDKGADGASILLERGGVAVVNGSRRLGRRRLTLAHELGHFVFADEFSTDWRVGDVSAAETELRIDRWARALLLPAPALRERWRGGEHTRTDAVRIGSEFRVDMATMARRLVELRMVSPAEEETVRAARTRRADIVDFNLVVPTDLEPPELPNIYEKAVLDAYRREKISAARAVGLLLGAWEESDLPDLPMLPAEALWSFV